MRRAAFQIQHLARAQDRGAAMGIERHLAFQALQRDLAAHRVFGQGTARGHGHADQLHLLRLGQRDGRKLRQAFIGLANAGGDTINAIKAANEFGVTKTMKLAGLLVFINDIHSLGLIFTMQACVLFGALGYFSGAVGRWINRNPRAGLWLDRGAGAIFVGLGLRLIVAR